MSRLAWRSSLRFLKRHPLQLVLTIIGIALGVAVVLAVDLANESAGRAFLLSMENLTGRATHQIIGGPSGLDERVYTALRIDMGVRQSAPIVEGYGTSAGETLHIMGVDIFAERDFRSHLEKGEDMDTRKLLTTPRTILMADVTAARMGLRVGESFPIALAGYRYDLQLVGLIRSGKDGPAAIDGLVVTDIATAQEMLHNIGRLSWIDIYIPTGKRGDELKEKISGMLPNDAAIVPAKGRTKAMSEMTRAFQTNLAAMSLLALLVGIFLIYNTMTFAVLQRRQLIGQLRIAGITRSHIFRIILGEAVIVGLAGTLLGGVIGLFLGQELVKLVTRTMDDLYFVMTVTEFSPGRGSFFKALFLGLGATIVAALPPALEAAGTVPHSAISRSLLEGKAARLAPRLALGGLVMIAFSLIILTIPGNSLISGFAALFMLILGMTALTPLILTITVGLISPVLGGIFGIQTKMAIRGVERALSRTGIAISVLMLAVSTSVGVGIMVESFRKSVEGWLESVIQADIYVTSPSLRSSRNRSRIDPGLVGRIRDIPGIAEITTTQWIKVEAEGGLAEVEAVRMAENLPPRYLLKEGDPESVWRAFLADEAVLLSEPYANLRGLRPGNEVSLRTDRGMKRFPVAGIFYDYGSGPGVVLMNRGLFDRYFDDPTVRSLGIYLQEDVNADRVISSIRKASGEVQDVMVRSNGELRLRSLMIFDRTFTITNVLRLLAILVAFVGILTSLMALQLERAREWAVLRVSGFTSGQLTGLITMQTAFMGLFAGLLAIPTGIVLSQVLIHVINKRSFGWSMETFIPPGVLIESLLLALTAALLAGIYPSWKMSRLQPAEALKEE